MSSFLQGFLFTANYITNFSREKDVLPFIFKADSIYVAKYPTGWP